VSKGEKLGGKEEVRESPGSRGSDRIRTNHAKMEERPAGSDRGLIWDCEEREEGICGGGREWV